MKFIFIILLISIILFILLIYTLPSKNLKADIKCAKAEDCEELNCDAIGKWKFYCDYNGFPTCREGKCSCLLACW